MNNFCINLIIYLFLSYFAFSQKSISVIKANKINVSIRDGDVFKKDYWTISPEVKPDVYETVVHGKIKRVAFITDVDSISFNVKPGKMYPFIILLNDKDSAYIMVNAVGPAIDFSKKQLDWLRKNSSALFSAKVTSGIGNDSYVDLRLFKKIVGNSQLVALGESTHGTSDFFTMKHRLLEYAVVELGFTVFAIEDNQLQAEIINDYVLHGVGSIDNIMNGMFGVWSKQEVLNMIKWMRDYNITHPDKPVEFVGFDMQNPKLPIDSLLNFLKIKDKSIYQEAEKLLTDFRNNHNNDYYLHDSIRKQWMENSELLHQKIKTKKDGWLKAAKNNAEKIRIEWALQNANVIKQCARSKYLVGHGDILFRDKAMAENISWIMNLRPSETKMIIWAHDVHISRGDDSIATYNYYSGISMGSYLSKQYGKNYKAIGFETYKGTYTAHPSYTDFTRLIDCPLNISPIGSLDKGLHEIASAMRAPGLILDLNSANAHQNNANWLRKPLLVRFANHVCMTEQYGLKYTIPYQFDGIIFIDKTTGSKSIH